MHLNSRDGVGHCRPMQHGTKPQRSLPLSTAPRDAWRGVRGVLTDIDDTLTRDGVIEPTARAALRDLAAAGLPVVAVTGRPMGWSEPFVRDGTLDTIVAENGAGAWYRQGGAVHEAYVQDAATRADRFIERIWITLQSLSYYRDRTTLLVTTDHGRGATIKDWSDHGKEIPAAEDTWIGALGPAVPPLGLRKDLTVTTAQFAATIAAVVGQDFHAAMPKTAAPLPLR